MWDVREWEDSAPAPSSVPWMTRPQVLRRPRHCPLIRWVRSGGDRCVCVCDFVKWCRSIPATVARWINDEKKPLGGGNSSAAALLLLLLPWPPRRHPASQPAQPATISPEFLAFHIQHTLCVVRRVFCRCVSIAVVGIKSWSQSVVLARSACSSDPFLAKQQQQQQSRMKLFLDTFYNHLLCRSLPPPCVGLASPLAVPPRPSSSPLIFSCVPHVHSLWLQKSRSS